MPVTNNLQIWSSSGINTMNDDNYASANQRVNGVQASEVISSNIHNTTLKSITTLQRALVTALLGNAGDIVGPNFTTNISEAFATSNFVLLFGGLKVYSASKWTSSRTFKISDGNGHEGTGQAVNGTGAVTLPLPATIQASFIGDLTGTASNASHINGKTFEMSFDANTGVLDITYITPQE